MKSYRSLQLWTEYSREEVHTIFSPNTTFTPNAGTWGLQGMIRVPDRDNDWVLYVTYGQEQGDHVFDESITEDGVLSWQSQPRLGFDSEPIQSLINHDDHRDAIHLFLRAQDHRKYAYLGRLKYLTHDNQREKPVYFQWQLTDWPPAPADFLQRTGIGPLVKASQILKNELPASVQNQLIVTDEPGASRGRVGTATRDFRERKTPDYGLIDSRNRELGLAGEKLALRMEIENLLANGRQDLADKVVHVSTVQGDGAGFDILSYDPNGQPKYIEVKTTKGSIKASFFISPNEIEFSKKKSDNYFLYRIYDFDIGLNVGKVFFIRGDLNTILNLLPTQFRASIK
jgi:hypothetical protein